IVFGTLHFGGSPVGELVLETRFSRIPREPPPSTFNYARDIAAWCAVSICHEEPALSQYVKLHPVTIWSFLYDFLVVVICART
ncbi:hypothetical protein, partial [Burkholderia cenocepacia]|uniref:hypothetical protein n=1 Tax=Burkholderia cenocepacia TaxID=95486 RepID=UPI001BA2E253